MAAHPTNSNPLPIGNVEFGQHYLESLSSLLSEISASKIAIALDSLRRARDQGRTIFTCGNGGSASIASELVVDLVKGASYERDNKFRAISLSDSIPTITAYANDVSYDSVFVEPLKNFAEPDDVLIAISGSGNSQNILSTVAYANENQMHTIGLTTSLGGKLREIAQTVVGVPDDHMGRLEDCFYTITHIFAYAFIDRPD